MTAEQIDGSAPEPRPMIAYGARAHLLRGGRLRMTIGDNVVLVRVEDGRIVGRCIAGWAAGSVEPICSAGTAPGFKDGSDYFERVYFPRATTCEVAP